MGLKMNREDLIIGIHGAHLSQGGRYNMLSSGIQSLMQAFRNNGVKAYSVLECVEKKLPINMTIGFNVTGYETWAETLSHNIPNFIDRRAHVELQSHSEKSYAVFC